MEGYSPIHTFYSFMIFSLLINAVILLLNCLVLILNKFYSFVIFCWLINAVILLLNCLVLILYLLTFSLLKHYLDLYITDTALKVS